MKKGKLKSIIVVALTVALSSTVFIGCGKEKKELKKDSVTASADKNEEDKGEEEKKEEDKDEKKEETNTESKKDTDAKPGEFYNAGMPGFEKIYKDDPIKDFKLEFAKEGLLEIDKFNESMPAKVKEEMGEIGEVFEQEMMNKKGTSKRLTTSAYLDRDSATAEKNIGGMNVELSFNDQEEVLFCNYEIKAIFNTGKDKNIKLDEEGIKLAKAALGDEFKDVDVQAKFDEAFKTEKDVIMKESKYERVLIRPNIYDSGNSVDVVREKKADYPAK